MTPERTVSFRFYRCNNLLQKRGVLFCKASLDGIFINNRNQRGLMRFYKLLPMMTWQLRK